jgi:hypothetical protein
MEESLFETILKKIWKKHLKIKDNDLFIDEKYEIKEISILK